ncbi:NADPH-dependent F420 reductase [Parvularcula maris]|uniref:NAD(P)-binding domain-containing protein n=1 Tax=Parvularcula maris TaxID=2965077 RepID=A0A9X2L8M0_9PROT|nr:NAD(P)-binding domain-containing protein [Parvularcula maris]MCQ8185134.1 NAD(P)-binding domain-containing protein [Parvularcula maris]
MHIAIIGAGQIGRALGHVWYRAGHSVSYLLREESLAKHQDIDWAERTVLSAEAARRADITVLAVPWSEVDAASQTLGSGYSGVLVDVTNPVAADLSGLDFKGSASGAAYLKEKLPRARIVKAFNQTGAENLADADYTGGRPVSFVCSSDEAAASAVRQLSEDLGFDTVVVRGLEHSRQLEEMAWLWISLAIKQGHGRDFAYALVRR